MTQKKDNSAVAPEDKQNRSADIKSVALTFRVLFELAKATEPTGVSELARRIGEARAAVHKHLITLRGIGVVMQTARTDRYRLGWKLVELGQAAEAQLSIVGLSDMPMRRLRDLTGLSTYLGQANGDRMVISHTVPSESMIAVTIRKGLEAPLHGSAAGRVMLAFSSADTRDRVLAGKLPSMSATMLTDPQEIRLRLDRIRERLYDSTAGESPSGIHTIAAPVLDDSGAFIASVGMMGTQAQIEDPPNADQVRLVQQCAASISKALGSDSYSRLRIDPWD